jgi:hypothetical protein
MDTLAKSQALMRTICMLETEWNIADLKRETNYIDTLLKSDKTDEEITEQIKALKSPIDANYFYDVGAVVKDKSLLTQAKTVKELLDIIWSGIPENKKVPLISKPEVVHCTLKMIREVWSGLVHWEVIDLSGDTSLAAQEPMGLGRNESDLRGLEFPIETNYFKDVCADVKGRVLADAEKVKDLWNIIWDAIPIDNKME